MAAVTGSASFQAYVNAQLDELRRRLLSEYEKQHGDSSSEGQVAEANGRHLGPLAGRDRMDLHIGDYDSPRAETPRPRTPGADAESGVSAMSEGRMDELSEGVHASAFRTMNLHLSEMKIEEGRHVHHADPPALEVEEVAAFGRAVGPPTSGTRSLRSRGGKDPRDKKEEQLKMLAHETTFLSMSRTQDLRLLKDYGSESSRHKAKDYGSEGSRPKAPLINKNQSEKSGATLEQLRLIGLDVNRNHAALPKRNASQDSVGEEEFHSPHMGSLDDIGKGSVASQDERQATFTTEWVILPGSKLYTTWSHCVSFLVLLSCFFTPLRFGFHESFEQLRFLEMISDVFFALDIMVIFNVALLTKKGVDSNRCNIFKAYVFSVRFWIDLLATVPFDDIWVAIFGDATATDQKISISLGMLRMLRVNRMLILFHEMQKNTKFNLLGVVVVKFVVFIMLSTHTAGCLFYALASFADFGADTWVQRVDPNLPSESLVTRYLNVLFWAVGTFKAGPISGALGPNSNSEKILACLTMMVNICLQTYLVSNMAALLTTADVRIYAMRNQLRQLEEFSKRYNLPHELCHQLRTCIRFKFASDQELDSNVLTGLPELYRQRISHVLFEDLIARVDLFKDCAPLFLRQLHGSLKSTLYMPDQQLVNIDEPSAQLQIISEGEVEMRDRSGCILGMCGPAESFTAVSFLCKVGAPFAVRTRVVCRVLSLDHALWENACSAFPENLHQVKMNLLHHCQNRENEFVGGCAGQLIYRELAMVVKMHLVMERETSIALFCAAAARGDCGELKRIMISQTPNCSNYDARTPLHLAASYGHQEAIQLLIDSEAFVDPVDNFGRTPLLEACRCRQERAAQLLSHTGATLSTKAGEIEDVRSKKSKDGVEKLCTAGELCQAASDVNELWYLKMLLKYGADPNVGDYDARTALHVACACGNKPAAELLLGFRGINMNPQDNFGRTPLMEAVRHGHEHVARLLKAHGAFHGFLVDLKDNDNPNAIPAGSELCAAASSNQITYMNNLLSFCDLDVDAADYDLRTALMLACAEGNMSIAVHLVQSGADINKKDRWGHTPITEAREHGFPELADVLKTIVSHGTLAETVKSAEGSRAGTPS